MSRLLNKTLRAYILMSLLVLGVSAPLFYWVTEKLYVEEADETLLLLKEEFLHYNLPSFKISGIENWNSVNRDVKIFRTEQPLVRDSIFQTIYLDTVVNEHEPYRVLFSPISIERKPFVLHIKMNLVETEDMIESIAWLFFLVLMVLLTGFYFITRFLSARLWTPFYSALDQIEAFDLDRNELPVWPATEVEEFKRLNQSIDKLLERNIAVYRSQREFTENAAHELQTPLAILQAKLDTLAQQMPLTTELSETLSKLSEAASRLARTNKNLLLLSKIDNQQYSESETVEVEDVLMRQLDFFNEQATEKNITVNMHSSHSLLVKANPSLVDIAISNLLLNALRHNVNGGEITIDIDKEALIISNTGNPQPLMIAKLFQRFAIQGADKGGSGLGLPIVKKIADVNGWEISYAYDGRWHVFKLKF